MSGILSLRRLTLAMRKMSRTQPRQDAAYRVEPLEERRLLSNNWQVIDENYVHQDYNHDGTNDILLQNTSTNQLGTWLIHTGSISSWVNMGTVPTGWSIAALGDFTGNGTTDILLENNSSGQFGAWLISNGSVSSWVGIGSMPNNWNIVGTGKYTGTGSDDLLIQNTSTGQLGIWLLNSSAQITSFVNLGSYDTTTWKVKPGGDLTGNGITDPVLWNQSSGLIGALLLTSSATLSSWDAIATLDPTVYNFGIGDFNADGTDDIGVANQNTGEVGAWFISAGHVTGSFHAFCTIPSGWSPVGTGDYQDNGFSNLLVSNDSSGQIGSFLVSLTMGNPVATWDNIGTPA